MTDQSTAVADVYPTRTGGDFLLMPREDPVTRGTPDDGPLDASELEGFATNGYLTHPELVTPDEVEEFRAELRRMVSDPGIRAGESTIIEASSQEVLSLFAVHESSEVFRKIAHDPRLVSRARQVLGTDVYIHQSRVDAMPGFGGGDVFWHSDFETWHAEDGMPRMRAVSISISLTRNSSRNGPLMIMPGSHTTYVSCPEATPEDDDTASLTTRGAGTPSPDVVAQLADRHGIDVLAGSPGSAVMFDCNCMHGSNGNISPYPRSTLSFVYNSVENTTAEPFGSLARRPEFLGARDFTPVP